MGVGAISIIVRISTHVHSDEKSQDPSILAQSGICNGPDKKLRPTKNDTFVGYFGKWHSADHWFDGLKSIRPQVVGALAILLGHEC